MDHVSATDADLERVAEGVYLGELAAGREASMMYWRVEPGATLPIHDHHNEQIGYMLSGELVALVEGEEVVLKEGDVYRFSSGERHGAENRNSEPAVGLGVLAPPREEPDWKE
ncbi:cupin domain-containing protein [Natrialbaceae archaeon A-gly3]